MSGSGWDRKDQESAGDDQGLMRIAGTAQRAWRRCWNREVLRSSVGGNWGAVCFSGSGLGTSRGTAEGALRLGQGTEAKVKTTAQTSELDRQVGLGPEGSHFGVL